MKRLLAIALLALACAQERPASPAAAKPKRDTVTLNLNPTLSYAPLMIALDEGFFAAEGIDAKPVSLDSNSAVAAVASGGIDVLSAGVRSGVFNMILRGAPLQIVSDKGHSAPDCSAEAFIAPVDAVQRIAKNGGSLRGERIAMTRGGLAEYLTVRLIEARGAKLDDVTLVQLPHGTAASTRDRLDAVRLTSEPNLSAVLHEGWAGVVATSEEIEPGHQNSVLVFGKRLLRDDPDLGRRFLRAYLRGVRRMNEGKSERNVAILARHTKLPPEMIRGACWMAFSPDGRIDAKKVQPFLDWALARKYLDAPIETAQWWNPSFADAAARELAAEGR